MTEQSKPTGLLYADDANRRRQLWETLLATALLLGAGWAAHAPAGGIGAIIGQAFGVVLVMHFRRGKTLHYPPWHRFLWLIASGVFAMWVASRLPNRCPPRR